ncbi:MAG: fibro-slime domain-containing protein [Fibromonadales bacterium]|nr:fibro-slime domain-containing protein [Fibromonadales bacterium]
MVLKLCFALLFFLGLFGCADPERNNIFDPKSTVNENCVALEQFLPKNSPDIVMQSGNGNKIEFDVIIRDFSVEAPGFELFLGCDYEGNHNSTEICFNSYGYMPCTEGGTQLRYGEIVGGTRRGYTNGPDALGPRGSWDQPVMVTMGMVQNDLYYDKSCPEIYIQDDPDFPNNPRDHIKYRYCARPKQGNGNCGSAGNLENWFSGYQGHNNSHGAKVIDDIIELYRQPDGKYLMNYDYNTSTRWNNDGNDNGFFPLDKYDDNMTWGRQSLNYWCPDSNGDVCGAWYANGGPKNPTAGIRAANDKNVRHKLHNYGFSLSGSATFKYFQGNNDVFEFIGDDDMWIFIDGELVADLGGVHIAAPVKININELAVMKGWADGTSHSINFFYTDRQTYGSNIMLRVSLTDLTPARFGAPRIMKAETSIYADGKAETLIWVTAKLGLGAMEKFLNTNSEYPIIIRRSYETYIWAYNLLTIQFLRSDGANGYIYATTGEVCKTKTDCGPQYMLNSGDSLSFNVKRGQDIEDGGYNDLAGFGLPDESWYIKSESNIPVTTTSWTVNTTKLSALPPPVYCP